jgi:hypothetical protein
MLKVTRESIRLKVQMSDLNRRRSAYEADALPTELVCLYVY